MSLPARSQIVSGCFVKFGYSFFSFYLVFVFLDQALSFWRYFCSVRSQLMWLCDVYAQEGKCFMLPYRTQKMSTHRTDFRSLREVIAAVVIGLVLTIAFDANAVTTGDQFTMIFSETFPSNLPDAASGIVTLGLPDGPGFFQISDISVIAGSVCLTCGLQSQDLTQVFFDALTLDLTGTITGTFLGSGGITHDFQVDLTDAPDPSWTYTDLTSEKTFSGIYRTERTVDEPPAILMLGVGLATLLWLFWQRRASLITASASYLRK